MTTTLSLNPWRPLPTTSCRFMVPRCLHILAMRMLSMSSSRRKMMILRCISIHPSQVLPNHKVLNMKRSKFISMIWIMGRWVITRQDADIELFIIGLMKSIWILLLLLAHIALSPIDPVVLLSMALHQISDPTLSPSVNSSIPTHHLRKWKTSLVLLTKASCVRPPTTLFACIPRSCTMSSNVRVPSLRCMKCPESVNAA